MARQNAHQAAESAALARQAADEANQWRDAAQASATQAAEAARQAQASAKAAQRSADQAAESARRARDAAAAADKSAYQANASAANASASASYANTMATSARNAADQARADAIAAGKDAQAAEDAAQQARDAAAKLSQKQDQQQNVGDVPDEYKISPFGIDKVPENIQDETKVLDTTCFNDGMVGGWGGVVQTCFFKVEHHVTGTLRFYTYDCPTGATRREDCRRVEIGTSPIDFRMVKDEVSNSGETSGQLLLEMAKIAVDDFRKCATDKGASRAEGCTWAAVAIFPPGRFVRLGELLATAGRVDRTLPDEFLVELKDGSALNATIDAEGVVDLAVKNNTGLRGIGGTWFSAAMDHFGGRVRAVQGSWTAGGDMSDNIDTFNALLCQGLSREDAARGTFTGTVAGKYGFTKVEFGKTVGTPGEYTYVNVIFS